MFTLGRPQRKYVYPSLFFLIMLFLMLLARMAAVAAADEIDPPACKTTQPLFPDTGTGEHGFLIAMHDFNDSLIPPTIKTRNGSLARQQTRVKNLQHKWSNANTYPLSGYNFQFANSRYSKARQTLEQQRKDKHRKYQDTRQQIQTGMRNCTRESGEFTNFANQLSTLDQDHLDQEKEIERKCRKLDRESILVMRR